MNGHNRRRFLADVGRGMLVAGVGPALAFDLGLGSTVRAAEQSSAALMFGPLEPLVTLMQESPLEKLQPAIVEKLRAGTELQTLVAAAALANARTFGGEDYIGFHTFMALVPAFEMARELPTERQALPVLKVLYRNTNRIQAFGGRAAEILHPVTATIDPNRPLDGDALRAATRVADWDGAEAMFAKMAAGPPGEAFNHLQFEVQDEVDVHRVVLAWRAWSTLDLTGQDHAHSLLRQSLRYCLKQEQQRRDRGYAESGVRKTLPRLLDQFKLAGAKPGDKKMDDAWVESLSQTIFAGSPDQAAEAVAAAIAEGASVGSISDALSLAANQLVLFDPGRKQYSNAEKPVGSVHGDSVGVHASDAANAWCNIAQVSNPRNTIASLIVAAYHTAGQSGRVDKEPYYAAQLESIQAKDADSLIGELEAAVRAKEQARACALVHRYGELNASPQAVFDVLLKFAISEDGALHAEKYYRTVREEFSRARPTFRWRQLIALARVTTSEFGYAAPGQAQARELLGIS